MTTLNGKIFRQAKQLLRDKSPLELNGEEMEVVKMATMPLLMLRMFKGKTIDEGLVELAKIVEEARTKMTIEEIKAKLNEKVPDFAARVAPVYELLRWEWSPDKREPHVPSVGEIEHALYGLIERLGEDCEDTSMGGLSVYYSMPDEDGPGYYGIAFELEEEVAFDR